MLGAGSPFYIMMAVTRERTAQRSSGLFASPLWNLPGTRRRRATRVSHRARLYCSLGSCSPPRSQPVPRSLVQTLLPRHKQNTCRLWDTPSSTMTRLCNSPETPLGHLSLPACRRIHVRTDAGCHCRDSRWPCSDARTQNDRSHGKNRPVWQDDGSCTDTRIRS